MILRYLLVFLLGYGNSFYSGLNNRSISCPSNLVADGKDAIPFFDDALLIGLNLDGLPDLIEENIRDGNEDSNDNENGKDFTPKTGLQDRWTLNFPDLFGIAPKLISILNLGENTSPIYLKNRVLRI